MRKNFYNDFVIKNFFEKNEFCDLDYWLTNAFFGFGLKKNSKK